jgi:K+-sensing histidine kinase KdpD
MRQEGFGKEPGYRRKHKEASERQRNAQQQEDVIKTIVSIRTGIDAMVVENAANRKQAHTHEHGKRKRDWAAFWALVATASAAILTLIVTHLDNRAKGLSPCVRGPYL